MQCCGYVRFIWLLRAVYTLILCCALLCRTAGTHCAAIAAGAERMTLRYFVSTAKASDGCSHQLESTRHVGPLVVYPHTDGCSGMLGRVYVRLAVFLDMYVYGDAPLI